MGAKQWPAWVPRYVGTWSLAEDDPWLGWDGMGWDEFGFRTGNIADGELLHWVVKQGEKKKKDDYFRKWWWWLVSWWNRKERCWKSLTGIAGRACREID